ncbi:transcriptional regulator [Immundisolibacter sp.]|uniref:transcriptional regulator n=1 Tax=Immundisolibacter sp. TaxID=1934948 RepID=UPI003569C168
MIFIEIRNFTARLPDYLSDDEYRELQTYLAQRPEAGDRIPGGGGLRKLRWAAKGHGKSGGVRVFYYWLRADDQIYLFTLLGKSERADLDKATLHAIAKSLETLK